MRKNSVKNIRDKCRSDERVKCYHREDIKDPRISPLTSVVAVESNT